MNSQTNPRPSVDGAKTSQLDVALQEAYGSWGSFGRFLKLINSEKSPISPDCEKGSGPRTSSYKGEKHALFPSLLVMPILHRVSRSARARARGRGRMEAWEWVKVLWALFTFFEGGSPFEEADQKNLIQKARSVAWTPMHSEYAGLLHKQIHRYVRLRDQDDSLSRGILKLSDLIKLVKSSSYQGLSVEAKLKQGAKPVKPDRMSLPSQAGIVDPRQFLKGSHLKQFEDMIEHIPLKEPAETPVKGCFKVDCDDMNAVYHKLLSSGVAVLLPAELAVKDEWGNIITGGLFAVDHKEHSDRIILDRRPFNQLERRLVWAKLPHGCLLTQLIVPPGYSIRGSGDDLSNYFYLLKHNQDWLPRNAIGSVFDGEGFEAYGGEKGKQYLLSFCVVAMGDLNAVDIAQQVHVEILKDCNCMREGEVLAYKQALPASHCYEGLYIDDHIAIQILPKKANRKNGRNEKFRDEIIMEDSRAQYAHHNIPTSDKKSFAKAGNFVAWGTEVDSESGRVGTPIRKLRQLGRVLCEIVSLKKVSKKMLQQATGLLIHPLMHRRCLMCLLQETFVWIENMDEHGSQALPPAVREELLWCALCLPVAEANARWPIADRIGCSDASLDGGGRGATLTTPDIAQALYRFSEHRGEHVRLDWINGSIAPSSHMQSAPSELEDIMNDHRWISTESCTFAHKQHINILEARMIYRELVDVTHSCTKPLRCVLLVDSRAAAGAWAKGRSSSKHLNRVLRRSLGWSIAGCKSLHVVWVKSAANPADHPSSGKPIPEPPEVACEATQHVLGDDLEYIRAVRTNVDIWHKVKRGDFIDSHGPVQKLISRDRTQPDAKPCVQQHPAEKVWSFREIFAGSGHLTTAFKTNSNFNVQEPFEIMKRGKLDPANDILNDKVFERLCRDAKKGKQIWHFGFPCGSFSQLQHLNKGTRSKSEPEGNNKLEREVKGNEILKRTLHLCTLLAEHGSFFTLENPSSSYAWDTIWYKRLKDRLTLTEVNLGQCSYNLRIPDDQGNLGLSKKGTLFAGNLPGLQRRGKTCNGEHAHVAVIGCVKLGAKWHKRSTLAGAYPKALCKQYVQICKLLFQ